jgi:Xaa-Pro aminopeptidase
MSDHPYSQRRARLLEQVPDGVLLVRGAASSGTNPAFRYLTGFGEPRGALLLAPGGVRIGTGRQHPGPDYVRGRMVHQLLLLPAANPLAARWGEDSSATLESVDAESIGVDAVLNASSLDGLLAAALGPSGTLRYVRARPGALGNAANVDAAFVERVRRDLFGVRVEDATPLLDAMRSVKDGAEVQAIERSVAVTSEALERAMSAVKAGMREFELEAVITGTYRVHGAEHAFDPIVAAGPNAMLLHYGENNGPIEPGGLVLVDTGASLDGYAADVTRTFPVDGTFTDRQREVYEAVLRAQEATIAECRPGALIADLHARAFEVVADAGFGDHFPHGTCHHLGLETHDAGDVHAALHPGAVITVEPGVYLADEEIGVRIEDDVLITEDGHRVLSAAIPKQVADVERAVRAG